MLIDRLEKEYVNRWRAQEPLFSKTVKLDELDVLLDANKAVIFNQFDTQGMLCVKLFNNVYLVDDIGYGDICNKCGSSLIAVYFNEIENDINLDETLWLPCFESYTFRPIENNAHVCAITSNDFEKSNVLYKSICCNSEWKYLKYDDMLGMTYSDEIYKNN